MAQNLEQESRKQAPPYISYKTFRGFLESLRVNGIPGRIDRSVMPSMSGAAQSSLVSALKFLGLMSPDTVPTDLLKSLVKSSAEERKKILHQLITTSYSFLSDGHFDLKTATARQLEEAFNNAGASGETGKKCISFFLGVAREAGLPLSKYLEKYTKGGPRSGGGGRQRRQGGQSLPPNGRPNVDPPRGDEGVISLKSWAQMLLDKFPAFDPSWTGEVQAKWFEGFNKLMRMKKDEEQGEGEEQ